METKMCAKCKRELPVESFSNQKLGKNGKRSRCKECIKEESITYRENNTEALKKYHNKYYLENKDSILEYGKQHYAENKATIAIKGKLYREKRKEVISERMKVYHFKNKLHFAKLHHIYKQEHAEECRISCQNREARKRKLSSNLTVEQWVNIKESFNNICAYCGKELILTQEHFIPLSKGGEYSANNIIPSCQSCNSSKNNKDFFTWYPKYKYFSKKRQTKILQFLNYKNEIQQLTLTI